MAGLDPWFSSVLAALALVPAHAQAVVCPAGEFATVGTKSFYWSAAKAKYDGAMAGCPANSSLVNVNSAAEMTSIKAKSETGEPAEKKASLGTIYTASVYHKEKHSCTAKYIWTFI